MRQARAHARSVLQPGEASQAAAWVGQALIAQERQAALLSPGLLDPPHPDAAVASATIAINDNEHHPRKLSDVSILAIE